MTSVVQYIMLKKYVCDYCYGLGFVAEWTYAEDGEPAEVQAHCPMCTARGIAPWIEMAVNGPPHPKEHVIDAEYTVIDMVMIEEKK